MKSFISPLFIRIPPAVFLVLVGAIISCAPASEMSVEELASGAGIRIAADFAGGDCGAKIGAASDDLGTAAGEIWVDTSCGTSWTTAVSIPANQVLRFTQGGTYSVSATITVGHLVGSGFGAPHLSGNAPTIIKLADSANLPFIVRIGTHAGSITDVEINGNKGNNLSAQDGIYVAARGVAISNVYVHDATRHGIYNKSWTDLGDEAGVLKIHKSVSAHNGGNGLHAEDAQDAFIAMSEFEHNGEYGIALINSNAARIEHSDVAHNKSYGIYATGDPGKLGTKYLVIVGNQFGNGGDTDIYIDGWNTSAYVSVANIISSNMFFGGDDRTPNTSDAIHIVDSFSNVVIGNVFSSSTTHEYRYGVNFSTTGQAVNDIVSNNSFIGEFGTGELNPGALTSMIGNSTGNNFIYNDLAVGGALLFGGSTGQAGRPVFRHDTGVTTSGVTGDLYGIEEAGVGYLSQMDRSGNLGLAGVLQSAGVVSFGDITPSAGSSYNLGDAGSNWGCIHYDSGTLGTCASDGRIKDNIADLSFDDAITQVEGLRPRSYSFKSDATDAVYHGLIAQEVEEIAPELVSTGTDGYKAVKYGDIQWLVLSAVKQVAESLESLASVFRLDGDGPTGITLYDTATGQPNCVQITNGNLTKVSGSCE